MFRDGPGIDGRGIDSWESRIRIDWNDSTYWDFTYRNITQQNSAWFTEGYA